MRRLCGPLRRVERREFFGRCTALERQGEALVVVPGLPVSEGCSGHIEVLEALPAPELLLIDPMAPLDTVARVRAEVDVPISEATLFDAPTVEAMAIQIQLALLDATT